MHRIKRSLIGLAAALWFLAPACWAAGTPSSGDSPDAVLAEVDGTVISAQQFETALAAAIRQKYYHRKPPEDQLAALRREVADSLVNRLLLLKEAQRRGIRADEEQVRVETARYERRYRDHPQWQENRAQILTELARVLEEQSAVAQLEAATRVVPQPSEAELRAYYESHHEQFTQPEQLRLSMILLKIDPSSEAPERERVVARARELAGQLANGADFAELARQHSDDRTAPAGGDLGYRHRGTLPQGIEAVVDQMAQGMISEPQKLLEGMAIFRLDERRPAKLSPLDAVRRSAAELWARERGEAQWRELNARLRAGADIRMHFEGDRAYASDSRAVSAIAAH